ncbi:MAG: hypothetical protein ABIH41_05085, partial [Nanoarchaeota archaeon]
MERKFTSWSKKKAIARLETLAVSEDRKRKMRTLLDSSPFRGIYADFVLADDSGAFRASLDRNQQFAADANELRIDTDIYRTGIPDPGIGIELDHTTHGMGIPAQVTGYINEAYRISRDAMGRIETTIRNDLSDFINWDEEFDIWRVGENISCDVGEKGPLRASKNTKDTERRWRQISKKLDATMIHETAQILSDTPTAEVRKAWQEVKAYNAYLLSAELEAFRTLAIEDLGLLGALIQHNNGKETLTSDDITATLASQGTDFKTDLVTPLIHSVDRIEAVHRAFIGGHYSLLTKPYDGPDNSPLHKPLEILQEHILQLTQNDVCKPVSRYLRTATEAKYTLRVEPKEPWNVTFGNDGGACIAVQAYHDGVTAGPAAGSVPYYLL